jgi:hypothetical protein
MAGKSGGVSEAKIRSEFRRPLNTPSMIAQQGIRVLIRDADGGVSEA